MAYHPDWNPLLRPSADRLREEALIEAEALRREAFDQFWRGVFRLLAAGAGHTLRAVARGARGVRHLAAWRRRQRAVWEV